MTSQLHRAVPPPRFGFAGPSADEPRAARLQSLWRWPNLAALLLTIPAFYMEEFGGRQADWAAWIYLAAAIVQSMALAHVAHHTHSAATHLRRNGLVLLLIAGLLLCTVLPPAADRHGVLALRLAVAFLSLAHMVWLMRGYFARGSVPHLLVVAVLVLLLCGVGFWWLEPRAATLEDGLWLAFTTAATVGYGDIVPTTLASKIFSVFVVLLGFGVLSLVTASIAAGWIESEERRIEREILHDLHQQLRAVRHDVAALREALQREPVRLQLQQPLEDQRVHGLERQVGDR
jgi:voltage-gated potassium channel